jgi:hypothetical protein
MKLISRRKRSNLRKGSSLYSEMNPKSINRPTRSTQQKSTNFFFQSKNELGANTFYEGRKAEHLGMSRKIYRNYVPLNESEVESIRQKSDMLFSDRVDDFGNVKREFWKLLRQKKDLGKLGKELDNLRSPEELLLHQPQRHPQIHPDKF